jgi:hypothetical protein
MPPVTREGFDVAPVREEFAKYAPLASLVEAGYLEPIVLFD